MKKNYTISIPRSTFWKIVLPAAVCVMAVGGLSGVFFVDRIVMPRVVGISDRGIIDVPDLVGVPWEEARQKLYAVGLRLQVSSREYNDTLERGKIISQQPEPGASVKKGRQVCAIVSDGGEVAEIPQVYNLTERAARRKMRKAGFNNVIIHKEYDERKAQDLVIGTVPPSGVRTSRELPIQVRVSKGPRPTHATVPNVIGEMLSDAKAQIEEHNLSVGKIEYRQNSGARSGTIVLQSLSPGKSVPLESSINLVVAATN
jgi:serine/threonine-protein kinase